MFARGESGYAEAVQGGWGPPAAPDVYVRPLDTDDVAAALAWATGEGVEVAIRSGGHGAWAPLPGGLLIDLASFDGVDVQDDIARIGTGNTWGRVADELAPHHLIVSSGDAGTVGVGGSALGAGNRMVMDPQAPPGPPPRMAGSDGLFAPLTDQTADRAAAAYARHPTALFEVRYLGGAVGAVPREETPLAWRDAEALVHWIAMTPPGSSDADLAAADAVWAPVGEGTIAVVGTFVDSTEEAWVTQMYPPDVLERLRRVKAEWDPGNVLHHNHNIRPS